MYIKLYLLAINIICIFFFSWLLLLSSPFIDVPIIIKIYNIAISIVFYFINSFCLHRHVPSGFLISCFPWIAYCYSSSKIFMNKKNVLLSFKIILIYIITIIS